MNKLSDKVKQSLGLNMPSANDLIRRGDFKSETDYLRALVEMSERLNNPDVRRALRNAANEQAEQDEKDAKKQRKKEYDRIRSAVTLDELDKRNIDREATRLARTDIAAGTIPPSELGARIVEHADRLTNKRKDELAAAAQFNATIREQWRK